MYKTDGSATHLIIGENLVLKVLILTSLTCMHMATIVFVIYGPRIRSLSSVFILVIMPPQNAN